MFAVHCSVQAALQALAPLSCRGPLLLPACAVVKFARATGDIHALSSADVRLIALAHGLEASEWGLACTHLAHAFAAVVWVIMLPAMALPLLRWHCPCCL